MSLQFQLHKWTMKACLLPLTMSLKLKKKSPSFIPVLSRLRTYKAHQCQQVSHQGHLVFAAYMQSDTHALFISEFQITSIHPV